MPLYNPESDGGGALELETPTGAVDGVNATFTFSDSPTLALRNDVNETHLGYVSGNTFNFNTPPQVGDVIKGCVSPGLIKHEGDIHLAVGHDAYLSAASGGSNGLVINSGNDINLNAPAGEITLTVVNSYVQVSEDYVDIDPQENGSVDIGTNTMAQITVDSSGKEIRLAGTANSATRISTAKLFIYDLPTVNPAVAGQIWNDGGTLKVSAG